MVALKNPLFARIGSGARIRIEFTILSIIYREIFDRISGCSAGVMAGMLPKGARSNAAEIFVDASVARFR
jgi:hypothetical protein